MGALCKQVGIHNAFAAELLAFMEAINIAFDKGWRKLWIEMDSLTLAKGMQTHIFKPPWKFSTLWSICKSKMEGMQIQISHIFREGNQVADRLSKLGLHHHPLKWRDSPPREIQSYIAHDHVRLPNYRFK